MFESEDMLGVVARDAGATPQEIVRQYAGCLARHVEFRLNSTRTAAIARILVRVVAATNAYKHCGDWPLTEPSGGGVMDGGGRRAKGEGE